MGDGNQCFYQHNPNSGRRHRPHVPQRRNESFRRFVIVVLVASFAWRLCMWWRVENLFDPISKTYGSMGFEVDTRTTVESIDSPLMEQRIFREEKQQVKTSFAENYQSNDIDQKWVTTTGTSGFQTTNKHFPRVFALTESVPRFFSSDSPLHRMYANKTAEPLDPVLDTYNPRSHSTDKSNLENAIKARQFTKDYKTHCVDMVDWQSKSYPVCNSIHELGILGGSPSEITESKFDFMGRGNWRSSFRIRISPPYSSLGSVRKYEEDSKKKHRYETLVLKLYHLHTDKEFPFDPLAFEMHRIDALISQRMTASPQVIDIYGYCGTTSLNEFGVVDLESKVRAGKKLSKKSKFRIAAQVAFALADLHGVDYPEGNNATIIHGDIKPENIFLGETTGSGKGSKSTTIVKLSDFNNSILRKWNKTSHKPCPYYHDEYDLSWGSGYKPVEHSKEGYPPLDESIDVFAIGGIFYYILVGKDPYFQYPKGKEEQYMKQGILPPLPLSVTTIDGGYEDYEKKNLQDANSTMSNKKFGGDQGQIAPPLQRENDRNVDNQEEQSDAALNRNHSSIGTVIEAIPLALALHARDRASAEKLAEHFDPMKNRNEEHSSTIK